MRRISFLPFLFIALLTFGLFACNPTSSLPKINGSWVIDIDRTVEENPSLQDNTPASAITKTLTVGLLDGMRLEIDTKNKTVSGKLIGLGFNNENFGVVEDSSSECTLLILRKKLTFIPDNDILTLKTEESGPTFVFMKEEKL